MSSRKLQQEFDKLQKKVSEGLQQFEDIYDKVTLTENANQKEKLEGDLRKEIKKLQRSRDQVKQWLGDSSNKLDKNVLQDNRTRIENAMERFKEVEKVLKMKQFSNEGLEMQAKLGARGLDEARKNDATKYITEVLDELNHQNELLSGELSQLNHKKKLGAVQTQIDDISEKIERNSGHIGKLELILRNLANDRLEPERIDDIRDDLDYYVENNQAADFVEYNEFYDVLELDESLDIAPVYPAASEEPASSPSPKKSAVSIAGRSLRSQTPTPVPEKEEKSEKNAPAKVSAPAAKAASPMVKVALPGVKTKAASPKTKVPARTASPQPRAPPPGLNASKPGSPVTAGKTVADELKKRALVQAAQGKTVVPGQTTLGNGSTAGNGSNGSSNGGQTSQIDSIGQSEQSQTGQTPSGQTSPSLQSESFWDSAIALNSDAAARLQHPLPFSAISQMLETSLLNCPDSFDLERPRQYNPVNVHPSSVDYPQEPMYELNAASVMRKFDVDTLFFCFYYSEGQDKLAKWNAARELAARGWMFHTETKQWFCRDSQKGRVNPDLDAYKYFDYQSSWLIRRKEKFRFPPELCQGF